MVNKADPVSALTKFTVKWERQVLNKELQNVNLWVTKIKCRRLADHIRQTNHPDLWSEKPLSQRVWCKLRQVARWLFSNI